MKDSDPIRFLAHRLFVLFLGIFGVLTLLFVGLVNYRAAGPVVSETAGVVEPEAWRPRNILADWESVPELVRQGYLLVTETPNRMGPSAADPEKRFTGNNLACTNCHLKAGTQAGSASWVGVAGRFPQFGARSGTTGSLEDRVNGCIQRSMNGNPMPVESPEMAAIISYMDWLGEGMPDAKESKYKGFPDIEIPLTAVDLKTGAEIYNRECSLCHGPEGKGVAHSDPGKVYLYPPLWGNDSYNDGAGMHRTLTAAAFIKSNMPFGLATWERPRLTDEEAFHVAGYINSFERPRKAGTESDYPDRTLKPVSTPYGPWADDFTASQHKYGPFPPIIAYYKEIYNLNKTK